jgi:hydroxyacylglutathione hydrolase
MNLEVTVIATSALGDRSYLASDGQVAVVVDPQRDVDRVFALAGRLGVRVTRVLETHIHNDYVSGGLQLAQLTGAEYVVAAADGDLGFKRRPVGDGDVVEVSDRMRVRVLATPGHTFHHLSYVLDESDGDDWRPVGVFTGGSLLFGTTGRTDLLGREHAHDLAVHQHASARRLADLLPDGTQVWPTHGFGSFCSASQSDAPESTIGREKEHNPVLRLATEAFVTETLSGLDAYPAYYAHMGATNAAGPAPVDLTPATRADAAELRARIAAGEWVVDLRHRTAYATAHLAGTLSFGLDGPMSTWLGWLINWGTPITLLAETPDEIAAAQRELVRIGIDRPAAAATGGPRDWATDADQVRGLPVADFAALAAARAGETPAGLPSPDVVLDVRLTNEWRAGHIADATHLPLPELPRRLAELPDGTVWVHCGSGYRASVASALLANAGRPVVLIDDSFANAGPAGLTLTTGDGATPPGDTGPALDDESACEQEAKK